jgi:hypothetical protein
MQVVMAITEEPGAVSAGGATGALELELELGATPVGTEVQAEEAEEVTATGTLVGVVLAVGSTPAPLPGQSVTVGAQEVMVTSSVS